jgi:antitoxin (DNA-binding transcriptional repressor) of toxin-antitoxin stability system
MKALSMRDLNRRTAAVLDELERGESFEVRRNGKAVGYLTATPPQRERHADWKAHFEWLREQPEERGARLLAEFEEDRERLRRRSRGGRRRS